MAKLNKDTKNIAHLSATLDIFSRCLSNCNCQKVIWNHSGEQWVDSSLHEFIHSFSVILTWHFKLCFIFKRCSVQLTGYRNNMAVVKYQVQLKHYHWQNHKSSTATCRSNLFLQFFFCRLLGLWSWGVGWAVGTDIILQPIHRLIK